MVFLPIKTPQQHSMSIPTFCARNVGTANPRTVEDGSMGRTSGKRLGQVSIYESQKIVNISFLLQIFYEEVCQRQEIIFIMFYENVDFYSVFMSFVFLIHGRPS